MRAEHVIEARKTASKGELAQLAADFIKQGFEAHVTPSWMHEDGSYNWKLAKAAHIAELPLSRLRKMDKDTQKTLAKVHHAIWLQLEDERLQGVIGQLEQRRAELRLKLVNLDVYGHHYTESTPSP